MKNEHLVIRNLEFIIRDRRSRPEFDAWGGFLCLGRLGGALLIPHCSLFIAFKKGLPLPSDLAIFYLVELVPALLHRNALQMWWS